MGSCPQSSLIICRRSWNGRGRLLRHFGERDDGEDRGNRKRRRLPFSVLPISHAGNFHVHPYNKRRLGTSQCQRRSAIVIVSNALTHFDTTGWSADDDLNGLTETNPSS